MATNKTDKVLNVPTLRFPGFTDEWQKYSLGEYFTFKNGLNPDAKRIGRGVKFISVMDILNNNVITYSLIRDSVEATEDEISTYGVKYGDILFQRSSETLEDVGHANVYLDDKAAVYGGFVIRGRAIKEYNPVFMKYALASPINRKRIIVKGAGAQHFNIGQDGLSKVQVMLPDSKEQNRIAALFALLDERIALQSKLIEDLKKLKSAIVERMLQQETESTVILSSLGRFIRGVTYSTEDITDGDGTLVMRATNITTGSPLNFKSDVVTISKKVSKEQLIATNDIVICLANGSSALIGKNSVYDGGCLSSLTIGAFCGVFRPNHSFVKWLFQTSQYRTNVARSIQGGNGAIANLSPSDILTMKFALPNDDVLNMYDNLLNKIDDKLVTETKLLDDILNQKCYLLSAMFI